MRHLFHIFVCFFNHLLDNNKGNNYIVISVKGNNNIFFLTKKYFYVNIEMARILSNSKIINMR